MASDPRLQVVAALGTLHGLDEAQTPFPLLKIPSYEEIEMGEWHLKQVEAPKVLRGYFSGLQPYAHAARSWTLKKGEVVWMSITPMETESQSHHALLAQGDVLIGGFGMGVLAYNIALKPDVKRVVVIERDYDIIQLAARIMHQWPGAVAAKVELVQEDMLEYRDAHPFDLAAIDIWPTVGDMALRPDMQRIVEHLPATRAFAAWGMEFDFIDWCIKRKIPYHSIRPEHWSQYAEAIGVPLIFSRKSGWSGIRMEQAMVDASKIAVWQMLSFSAEEERRALAQMRRKGPST